MVSYAVQQKSSRRYRSGMPAQLAAAQSKYFNDEETRRSMLLADAWIDPNSVCADSVFCLSCRKTIQLDKRNGRYYPANWNRHKKRCLETQAGSLSLKGSRGRPKKKAKNSSSNPSDEKLMVTVKLRHSLRIRGTTETEMEAIAYRNDVSSDKDDADGPMAERSGEDGEYTEVQRNGSPACCRLDSIANFRCLDNRITYPLHTLIRHSLFFTNTNREATPR
ncbi:uncharacterized protein BT62DRAFT_925747 [Guyanagaster necrorhizus]|uniref:Uncharacterized protein n=1 Tax=Guyanagaster necrorhizus TaxID=856835 RepID=A0A9P7W5Z4_9AGAR|nr:uncharacterized protein BT62DRAFT_925747 [Guyanagaster necrorhizus MCA 3950]KAG7453212.1 hypothetical protein BT62DRAFT_925747 [Guyanagaster necrorhizus MCA 3950]